MTQGPGAAKQLSGLRSARPVLAGAQRGIVGESELLVILTYFFILLLVLALSKKSIWVFLDLFGMIFCRLLKEIQQRVGGWGDDELGRLGVTQDDWLMKQRGRKAAKTRKTTERNRSGSECFSYWLICLSGGADNVSFCKNDNSLLLPFLGPGDPPADLAEAQAFFHRKRSWRFCAGEVRRGCVPLGHQLLMFLLAVEEWM